MDKENNFRKISIKEGYFWKKETTYYPLFGKCEDEWYPLINQYDNKNEFFNTFNDFNSLWNFYNSYEFKYKHNPHYSFLHYIEKYYEESYNKLNKQKNLFLNNQESIEWIKNLGFGGCSMTRKITISK